MKSFENILFPVDFSPRTMAMAPRVMEVAGQFGAKLTLLHALDLPPAGFSEWYAYVSAINVDEMLRTANASLERFQREYLKGTKAELVVDPGAPAEAIANHVKKQHIDLVMMPTHGHGKFRSLMLGSVTAGVLHDVHCAVWTDAHAQDPRVHVPGEKKMVLCAVDLAPPTVHVLEAAKIVAKGLNADLHVVHSEPAVQETAQGDSAARFRRFLIYRALEDFAPLATLAGISTDLEVIEGPVGASIAKAASAHKACLLVVGRGAIQGTLGRLRTHAYELIRRAPCPVLSV